MLFLMQTVIVYEEWWVGRVPNKLLKQGIKKRKTKAGPSGHKKKKYKQLASFTHMAALYKYSNTFVNFNKNCLKMSHTIKG